MIKRLIPFTVLYCILLFVAACIKHDSSNDLTLTKNLITEAKDHFIFEISVTEGMGAAKRGNRHHYLQKTPVWEQATVERVNSINTVVVPVYFYDTTLNVRMIDKDVKKSLNDIGYLLVFRDPKRNNRLTSEMVYLIPDKSSSAKKFSGTTIIEQWDGTILGGYKHSGESVSKMSVEMASPATFAKGTVCEITDWYTCAHMVGYPEYCRYDHTTTQCVDVPDPVNGGTNPGSGDPGGGVPAGGSPRVGGGDRPVRVIPEPLGVLDICTKSFQFKKVLEVDPVTKTGGWQVASVTGLHMNLLDTKGTAMFVNPGLIIYFSLPVIRASGEFYSPIRAAEIARDIDNAALNDVMDYYHSGTPINWEGMNAIYLKALGEHAKQYGGKAGLTPGLGNVMNGLPAPTFASYSGIFGNKCDD